MNSFEIIPYVMVFQNQFDNIDEVLSVVKNSEVNSEAYAKTIFIDEDPYKYFRAGGSEEDDHHDLNFEYKNQNKFYIRNWNDWYTFGKKTEIRPYVHYENETEEEMRDLLLQYSSEELYRLKTEKNISNQIQDVLNKSLLNYISKYDSKDIFPKYVDNWDSDGLNNKTPFGSWDMRYENSAADILKHNPDTPSDLAISWHTDRRSSTEVCPGARPIVTLTVYLNDDYEGGEVSFLNEEDESIITYKPKAGDVVVFPSGKPFYHAANKLSKNNKYLLRQFVSWNYIGDKDWLNNLNKYGEAEWLEIDSKRIEKEDRASNKILIAGDDYLKTIECRESRPNTFVINGEYYNFDATEGLLHACDSQIETLAGTPFLVKNEIYIDGRNYEN